MSYSNSALDWSLTRDTMDTLHWIVLLIFSGIIVHLLPSYFRKKGENLATKEDIGQITSQIEGVKSEFTQRLNQNSFRYEKEFELLQRLSRRVIRFRDATVGLRPMPDIPQPGDEVVLKQKRIEKYKKAGFRLYKLWEYDQAFYPSAIYDTVKQLVDTAKLEELQYRLEGTGGITDISNSEEADRNAATIREQCKAVVDAIRERVTIWEKLHQQ